MSSSSPDPEETEREAMPARQPELSGFEAASEDESAAFSFRRILVALDASAGSRAALEAAAELAEVLHSELTGLFVEDVNLLRAASLPFAREIRFPAAVSRRFDSDQVERMLRARASELRREMLDLSRRHSISSSFRVVRGAVEQELLDAALDADLLALGRLGHAVARRPALGSTARAAIARAARPVLVVRPDVAISAPLVVVDDGGPAGLRALGVAIFLMRQRPVNGDGELLVLTWAEDDDAAYTRRQALAAQLEPVAIHAHFQHFHDWTPETVRKLIAEQGGGLVVLGLSPDGLPVEAAEAILENAQQHVLVIR